MCSDDKEVFNRNIETITTRYPFFQKEILEKFTVSNKLKLHEASNGAATATLEGNWIHSSRNPQREAQKLVNSGLTNNSGLCLIYGFGLGYHIEAIRENLAGLRILVIEPEPGLFLRALYFRDFKNLILDDNVGFVFKTDPDHLHGIISEYNTVKIQTLKLRSLYERNIEYYEKIDEQVKSLIAKKETNMNTLKRFGRVWTKNLFKNIEIFRDAGDAGCWFDSFSGLPAFVAAAGPSLDRVLTDLKEISRRAVIICVDTALRALVEKGVAPDFIFVIDPQYLNTRHLDNCLNSDLLDGRSVLISESSTCPSVFRNCNLPVYFFKSVFPLGKLLDEAAGIHSELGAGGSVATTAWDFAKRIGCNEIYTAGLDLGFPDKRTHCRQSLSMLISHQISNRISPIERITFDNIMNADPYLIKNNSGGQTLTDKRLIIYKWWFEGQIKNSITTASEKTNLYTLSREGIYIEGMNLAAVSNLTSAPEARRRINRIIDNKKRNVASAEDNYFERIKITISSIREECERLEKLCCEALEITDKIKRTENQKTAAEGWGMLSEIDRKISSSPTKEISGFIIQPVLNDIIGNNASAMENSLSLYQNLFEACKYNRQHADSALAWLASIY